MNQKIKANMFRHNDYLSQYACYDQQAIRLVNETSDIRPDFFRDIDRIIYSSAYARYIDKTQVYSLINNDHISRRMTHVQLVSKIARTIGRALALNEDLIEAAALGHDLGHVPFGHVGEAILNQLSLEHQEGYFQHNMQSVRNIMVVEKNGQGLNLTLQVLDAIMCHNGEMVTQIIKPQAKDFTIFLAEYNNSYQDLVGAHKLRPMTLEGCVVRISDIIAYLGKDIEDAEQIGLFDKKKLPAAITKVLGQSNKEIINTIIMDIITNSINHNYIKLSTEVFKAVNDLKSFNYQEIYLKANSQEQIKKYEKMFNQVFNQCLKDLETNNQEAVIYQDFLNKMEPSYIIENSPCRIVIDFMAGMTDAYLVKQAKEQAIDKLN